MLDRRAIGGCAAAGSRQVALTGGGTQRLLGNPHREAFRPLVTAAFNSLRRHGMHCTSRIPRWCSKRNRSIHSSETPASRATRGAIHVIVGPMFAGKSSRLLEESQRLADIDGSEVLYLKSIKDTRYSDSHIATHTGKQMPCFPVSHLIRDVLLADSTHPVSNLYVSSRVIAIDESQFFGEDLTEFCAKAADEDGKKVVVAGLDGDFLRGKFGRILDLIPLADSVTKLHATCKYCGDEAIFSKKIVGDLERQEEIGGGERYVAVCRRHY
jgi:thymidine kinase